MGYVCITCGSSANALFSGLNNGIIKIEHCVSIIECQATY